MGEVGEVTVTLEPPALSALIDSLSLSQFGPLEGILDTWNLRSYEGFLGTIEDIKAAEEPLVSLGWRVPEGERTQLTFVGDGEWLRALVVKTLGEGLYEQISEGTDKYKAGEGTDHLRVTARQTLALSDVLEQLDREESR